jgi:hypothetical protein
MTVDAIKHAISALGREDRRVLSSWLNDLDYDAWDRQIARDFSTGGKGMSTLERVRQEIAAGQTSRLEANLGKDLDIGK